jgi:hypothetical protein
LNIVDSIIRASSNTANAVTASAGTVVTLINNQIVTPAADTVARVSIAGYHSIISVVYDKANSTLSNSLNSVVYFQTANVDSLVSTGNISASQYNFANGVNILSTVAGTYANANVSTYLPTYTGNIAANIVKNGYTWTFGSDGSLAFPRDLTENSDPYLTITGGANPGITATDVSLAGPANLAISSDYTTFSGFTGNRVQIYSDNGEILGDANLVLTTNNANTDNTAQWTFGTDAVLTLPSGATILESGYGSAGAIRLKPNGGTSTQYLEIAPTTVDGNHVHLMAGSGTELFLGDDNHYVKLANTGGVVINSNDSAGNTAQWTFGTDGNLTLPQGGTITEGGGISGAIRLTPAGGANANQALLIYPTGVAEGDHIHLTAGGGSTELYLGNDFHYVKLVDGGNIELRAATANLSSQAAWTFDTTGNIDTIQALGIKVPNGVPTNVAVINSTTGSWEMNPMSNLATTGGTGSGLTVNVAEVGGYASTIEIATAGTGYTNGDLITVTSGTSNATFTIVIGGRNSWRFGIDGNLTLPQTGYLKVGSGIVPAFISSPAPIITGFSNISAQNFTFLANGVNILSAVGAYQTFANANAATQATSINTINNTLTSSNVAIGLNTGSNAQSSSATAVGAFAGYDTQGIQTVAIGSGAGYTNQKQYAVAVGYSAGSDFQGAQAVAIGADAGYATQGAQAVAIGLQAGQVSQGTNTVAIGSGAGQNTQGVAAVAIGFGAGQTNQGNNSIILNATGSVLNRTTASTFTVAPVRNDSGNVAQALYYNTTTKEVTYANATAGGNYSNTNVAAYLSTATITTTGNVTAANFVGNISITGNVTGTSSNVTLQAGAYTSVFDNQGNVTVPQLFTAGNIQTAGYLVGNALGTTAAYTGNVTVGGNLTIIGTKSNVPVKTGGFVAQNTAVSIDSITAQWLNTGGLSANQLQLAALNGNVSILYTYTFQDGTGGSTTGGSSSTTLANLSFGWTSIGNPSGVAGDMYNVLVSLPGTNAYRITAMTGSSYSDNVLTVERLV